MIIGIFVGITSGLLGVGGGFFMVPFQFFLLSSTGINPDLALRISIGTSLAIIIPTGLSGVYTHYHELKQILIPGVFIGVWGMIGGIFGGATSAYIPANILETMLGIFLILIAIYMLINKNSESRKDNIKLNLWLGVFLGLIIGFLSGLLGLGGGIFLIPLLIFLLDFSIIEAIAISSIFISLSSIGGTVSYIITGLGINPFPYSIGYVSLINFGMIAIFSIPFAFIGAKLAYKLSERKLKSIFAILMILIGIKILGIDIFSYFFKLLISYF
ncbi:MAG: sulfite exporter TauE/SafE family protein [Methanobacteriaceae archaeon]|nr:sulfite exporter TauE/SafE family protein [Candidatus Methanorudis spinitermitis]